MRYLFLILCFLAPIPAIALTGDAVRFDSSGGLPAITDDNTETCDNQTQVRFDSSAGLPAEVLDATATCVLTGFPSILTVTGGTLKVTGGTLRVNGGN